MKNILKKTTAIIILPYLTPQFKLDCYKNNNFKYFILKIMLKFVKKYLTSRLKSKVKH